MVAALMLGSPAQAADMPLKAPPMAAPVMYNWTGFYIGGHIGGAWADRNGHDRFDGNRCFWDGQVCFDNNDFGRNDGRFIVGGQVGFNYQINQWVWGVEGQISAITSHDHDNPCGFFTWGTGPSAIRDHMFNCDNRGDWVATIAARLGVTFGQTGNWLLYVKGGAAFADARFGVRLRDDCIWDWCNSTFAFRDNNDTRTGWMVGVGLEYGAWGNWSWKLEYNFMDFGHRNIHFDNAVMSCECTIVRDLDADLRVNVVKFGLNYRFAPAPVAAPAVTTRY